MDIIVSPELERLLYENTKGGPPYEIAKKYRLVYAFLCNADDMREVYARTSLHCERLKNDPNKKMSIKLNDAWRLEFVLRSEGTKQIIKLIRISNHYE